MRMKKVLHGTALAALATAAWLGAESVDASAADFPVGNVNVSSYAYGDEYRPSISVEVPEGCKEIMFGVATYNATKGVKVADNSWDVYDESNFESYSSYNDETGDEYDEGTYAIIDLSKLSITKDNYVAIKSESHTPIFIKIGASVTQQKVDYDADKNTISFEIKKSSNNATVDNTQFEYRTPYGNWSLIPCYKYEKPTNGGKYSLKFDKEAKVFQEYQHQGTSLYVRAQAKFSVLSRAKDDVKDANDREGKKTFPLYEGGYMPGKESKLTINKKANGPSVAVDYVKSEVAIPAKTEYRVLATGGTFSATAAAASKESKKVSDLLALTKTAATSGTLEVRKQANGTKTPSSKWMRIDIAIQDKIAANSGFNKGRVMTATEASVKVPEVAKGIKIEPIRKTSGAKDYSGYINVTVDKSVAYYVNVQVGTVKAVVKNDGTAKKIKATAKEVIKIAVAGDKKTKVWASDYTEVGNAQ